MMKILYVCTHNRCRSILSEAITNAQAGDVIEARSAGSQPAGEVHPLTLKYLAQAGIATHGLHSKSWDTLADFKPDVVITLCDAAAGESCPVWLGQTLKLHWGLADPSRGAADDPRTGEAFATTIEIIAQRVERLRALAAQPRDRWTEQLQQMVMHAA